MRIWLILFLLALPGALYSQSGLIVPVPDSQCIYWLGDKPGWTPVDADPAGARPFSEYQMTADATVVWVRCHTGFDAGIKRPGLAVGGDSPEKKQVYFDGQLIKGLVTGSLYPISPDPARSQHIVDVRVLQNYLSPGNSPGRPAYIYFVDISYTQQLIGAQNGDGLRNLVPVYSSYLVIGTAGLFLLGLFFFDRSQQAALWLGLYCLAMCITRLSLMSDYIFLQGRSRFMQPILFGISMFESWALVRVSFALSTRRVPAVYWIVFAAWVFIFAGSVLPVLLPPQLALPLSLFVQVTCFKPIWCIWTFACTAPFVAFWPWTRLSSRMRTVAALCAAWAIIEGWFQFQQVVLNRDTWSNQVQNWMSLAIACLIVAIFGHIFHEQRISADERAEMRGELSAARQVQHLLIPDKMQVTPGVTVSSAFLPAHEVGGDFYLCRALPNGAQRVLLGDVSGKGVAAALTSALLLGAADRCDDLRPAAVLHELNAALRNSGIEGFTTCLCADLSSTGLLLIANAGQLPPYRNGQEITVPPGLPLGVEGATVYAETSLQLAPGDKLTFLSDGVVEARNAVGELFGFERTRQLSSRAAQQIADAAVQFGQQDDITVLTLSLARLPASA